MKYRTATVHYERSSEKMHEGYLNTPGLFLFSKTDPISDPATNGSVIEKWEKKGLQVRNSTHWKQIWNNYCSRKISEQQKHSCNIYCMSKIVLWHSHVGACGFLFCTLAQFYFINFNLILSILVQFYFI